MLAEYIGSVQALNEPIQNNARISKGTASIQPQDL